MQSPAGQRVPPTYISGLLTRFLFFDHRYDLFVSESCLHLSVLLLGGFYTNLEEFLGRRSTAKQLIPIVEEIGDMPLASISGALLKSLGPKLKPNAATDTWWREIVTPASAVINNAHELEGTPVIRVRAYDNFERIAQDKLHGKQSRIERTPANKEWIEVFCKVADPYSAILARFMFETAARIDQAISLQPDDLRPSENKVRLKAQKGHPEDWVTVSRETMDEMVALPPKRPKNRKTGKLMEPRFFCYGSSTGYNSRWQTICKEAGIQYLSAHPAGRHAFFTELVVRQGVDPVKAAKAGRWSGPNLPMRTYAHAETDEADVRARFRTNQVQDDDVQSPNDPKLRKE